MLDNEWWEEAGINNLKEYSGKTSKTRGDMHKEAKEEVREPRGQLEDEYMRYKTERNKQTR